MLYLVHNNTSEILRQNLRARFNKIVSVTLIWMDSLSSLKAVTQKNYIKFYFITECYSNQTHELNVIFLAMFMQPIEKRKSWLGKTWWTFYVCNITINTNNGIKTRELLKIDSHHLLTLKKRQIKNRNKTNCFRIKFLNNF